MQIPGIQDMLAARERIAPYIHCTPVLTSRMLNELTGATSCCATNQFAWRMCCHLLSRTLLESAGRGLAQPPQLAIRFIPGTGKLRTRNQRTRIRKSITR